MARKYLTTKRKSSTSNRPTVRAVRRLPFGISKKTAAILATIFVLAIGGFGAWKINSSNASTYGLTAKQCYLLGRPFRSTDGLCYSYCQSGAGYYITSKYWGYCSEALSTGVSSTKCTELNRVYLFYGCTRRWIRTALTGAQQCRYTSYTYYPVTSGYDSCKGSGTTSGGTTNTSGWTWPVPSTTKVGSLGWGEWTSRGYHKGIDIGDYYGSTYGKNVVAAKSGKVTQSWFDSSCGYMMVIKADGTDYYTGYQHLATRSVGVGTYVTAGTKIGTVGKYGETTCGGSSSNAFYHLHFSVEKGNWLSWYSSSLSNSVNPCGFYSQC